MNSTNTTDSTNATNSICFSTNFEFGCSDSGISISGDTPGNLTFGCLESQLSITSDVTSILTLAILVIYVFASGSYNLISRCGKTLAKQQPLEIVGIERTLVRIEGKMGGFEGKMRGIEAKMEAKMWSIEAKMEGIRAKMWSTGEATAVEKHLEEIKDLLREERIKAEAESLINGLGDVKRQLEQIEGGLTAVKEHLPPLISGDSPGSTPWGLRCWCGTCW